MMMTRPANPVFGPRHRGVSASCPAGGRARGFTLVEWAVVIGIMGILMAMGTFAFRDVREGAVLAQARNALLTHAAIARNYAVANHIETMLVVNPYNGRFEIWHLNPPPHGGIWDPQSGTAAPALTDGYAYAPVLDAAAGLPLDGNGAPMAVVHPIDYDDATYRPTDPSEQSLDNLTWAAFCFDENGKLVIRSRRIATRSFLFRNGFARPASQRNRLPDETPNLKLLDVSPFVLVDGSDTAITSTRGFVISDLTKMSTVIGTAPTASELMNSWLMQTRPGGRYAQFAETIVLDRFSGQRLAGDS